MDEAAPITITPASPEAKELWTKALELAELLGSDEPWTLIGGLMVQLHAFERGAGSRPTVDIDLLGDSRSRPAMTERIARVLVDNDGEMHPPPVGDETLGFRYELDGQIIEVVGSEGVRSDPKTIGRYTTFQASGGTQALRRSETVLVSLDGGPAIAVRRPTLLGAILIKAKVVSVRREKFPSDRQDLIRLLSFVDDPRGIAKDGTLRDSEKQWLRRVESALRFDDPALLELFQDDDLTRARQAFRLLAT